MPFAVERKKIFADFKQAFDIVWRKGLWYKLLGNGMVGCYAFIRNMYLGIKP